MAQTASKEAVWAAKAARGYIIRVAHELGALSCVSQRCPYAYKHMSHRRVYDEGVHFITFSCYKRRRLLDADQAKRIVVGGLGSQLAVQRGRCVGFVIMPNHVHALVSFGRPNQSTAFLKEWKQRSSQRIRQFFIEFLPHYAATLPERDPVWQPRSYDFNVVTEKKVIEKLQYIHNNPVKAGLVTDPCDWPFSSARFYLQGKSVGLTVGMA